MRPVMSDVAEGEELLEFTGHADSPGIFKFY